MKNSNNGSRRKFLYDIGLAGLSIPFISAVGNCTGETKNKKPCLLRMENWESH